VEDLHSLGGAALGCRGEEARLPDTRLTPQDERCRTGVSVDFEVEPEPPHFRFPPHERELPFEALSHRLGIHGRSHGNLREREGRPVWSRK
jgi:hypothetical protein